MCRKKERERKTETERERERQRERERERYMYTYMYAYVYIHMSIRVLGVSKGYMSVVPHGSKNDWELSIFRSSSHLLAKWDPSIVWTCMGTKPYATQHAPSLRSAEASRISSVIPPCTMIVYIPHNPACL